jgi:hypothetical protein
MSSVRRITLDAQTRRFSHGFRKSKDTIDAIGLMRITCTSEMVLDVKEDMGFCFIDRQNAFDPVQTAGNALKYWS